MEEKEPTTRENPSLDDAATVLHDHSPAGHIAPGSRIGHYTIREVLGEGGFAVVYLAEQTEPVRRRVALKILKPGMDTKEVIARFQAERQALAIMDHPHVAKVFDAGATEVGRPYFVMEHVPGIPITEYCDRHRLAIRERLDLFIQACEAVQHAHQKGIIHRDIKPSNVMVMLKDGGAASVKVIDFGVAKAMNQRLSERTIFTGQGQLIGTPEYMSPEQAEMSGLDIDTRADIYSLGVLLYELLMGALPFDQNRLRHAAFLEIQRIIREEEPPKPSTRLSRLIQDQSKAASRAADTSDDRSDQKSATWITQHRRTDPRRLVRELRGDLDWITMKALDKDRNRRYATASEFAADVHLFLEGEPISGIRPSVRSRITRAVRRHALPLNVVNLIGISLGIFLAMVSLLFNADIGVVGLMVVSLVVVALLVFFLMLIVAVRCIERGRFARNNFILAGLFVLLVFAHLFFSERPEEAWTDIGVEFEEAETLLLETYEDFSTLFGSDQQATTSLAVDIATFYGDWDRQEEADKWWDRVRNP